MKSLEKAILHRKNALFYKTVSGANPLDYLTELQCQTEALSENPQAWMPWDYRERLKPADTPRTVAR